MKKILLMLSICIFAFANELNFKKVVLDEFQLQGVNSKITFKSKANRDLKMAQQWAELMKLNDYSISNSIDSKIYAVYTDIQKDSFDYFVGFKSKIKIDKLETMIIPKSKYHNDIVDYNENTNMTKLWNEISNEKIDRNYKTEIEVYDIKKLNKKSFKIDIYLSYN